MMAGLFLLAAGRGAWSRAGTEAGSVKGVEELENGALRRLRPMPSATNGAGRPGTA